MKTLTQHELSTTLSKETAALGLNVREDAQQGLAGETESIRAKWWFGGRKVAYRMSCRLSESDLTVHFRESVVEQSWGIPPPALTVETTTTSGWKRSGERRDVSVGGGGSLDYAKVRDVVEAAVAAAGWKFHLESGRSSAI